VARFDTLLAGVDVPVHRVTERAAKALSDTVTPVGLVAVCQPAPVTITDVVARRPGLVVVAVGISEPGNAGTLIRLADAMGADAVVLAGHSVDPYNAKCLRASAGSVFAVPVVAVPESAEAVARLARCGLQVLATTVDGETALDEAQPLLSRPTAWLFGPEAHGLPDDVARLASQRIRIPMAGEAESLNVAAAAAICLYQSALARRR
jgi:RNA methyltransferase, TrmH family